MHSSHISPRTWMSAAPANFSGTWWESLSGLKYNTECLGFRKNPERYSVGCIFHGGEASVPFGAILAGLCSAFDQMEGKG